MAVETLEDLRSIWEAGMNHLQTFDIQKTHGSIISVVQNKESEYLRVMCYFQLGENWVASCDLDSGTLVEALEAVNRRLN